MFEQYYGKAKELLIPKAEYKPFPSIDDRDVWDNLHPEQKEFYLREAEKPAGVDRGANPPGDQQVDTVLLEPAAAVTVRNILIQAEQGREKQHLAAVGMAEKPKIEPAQVAGRISCKLGIRDHGRIMAEENDKILRLN